MTRAEFLKASTNYPPARAGWSDARSFSGDGWVAGRVVQSGQQWKIESGGGSLEISFDAPLIAGDLAAFNISQGRASEVVLLTPAPESSAGADANSATKDDESPGFSIARSEQWALYLSALRLFFLGRGFIEAQTPTLVPSPGTEPFLDPFSTEWFVGSHRENLYLPTSPEFHLKQMLVRGWTKIFEMKPCFRNGEIGEHHQPEFLMLEWYRAYNTLEAIADDVDALLQTVARQFSVAVPKLKRTTIAELFANAFPGFHLQPQTTRDELAALAAREKIAVSNNDSFDDVFFRLFLERIESKLGVDGPLLVSDYPPSQAALSRIGPNGFAERFEVYWNGLELANAFHELNDPAENEKRFGQDAVTKAALGKPPVPRDENLIRALKKGMPPSGGIALGVDRLFMAMFGIKSIAETRAFPLTRRD
jgi:lysyl-tRNA synthetase class 2